MLSLMYTLRTLAGSLAVFLGTLGCAGLAPPLTCPVRGGAPWARLETRHFSIETDLPIADARDAGSAFERSYDAFTDLVFPAASFGGGRVAVVLFQREKDYRQFGGRMLDGYYMPGLPHDVEPVPTMVLFGEITHRTLASFQHQLTHHFTHRLFGPLPTWLDEGLAVYYSTLLLEGGRAYLGKTPDWSSPAWFVDRPGLSAGARIPLSHLPSVEQLFAADRTTFYAHAAVSFDTPEEECERQTAHYMSSWALVYMLVNGPLDYRSRFKALRSALIARVPFGEAWKAYFGDLSREKLEGDYRHFLAYGQREVEVWKAEARPAKGRAFERAMWDAEVHLLWARLLPWEGRAWAARAGAQIEEAGAADPGSPEVWFWRGLFDLAQGRLRESEEELCRAHAKRPEERRYALGLSRLFSEEDRRSPAPPDRPRSCPPANR